MNRIEMFKFNKFMIFYQVKDMLLLRQNAILEKTLSNPNLSVDEGFEFYKKIEENTKVLNTNFNYITEYLEKLSFDDRKLLTEYVFKNKSAKDISKANNYSERTFFRRWHRIVEGFFSLYSPSRRFEELLGGLS